MASRSDCHREGTRRHPERIEAICPPQPLPLPPCQATRIPCGPASHKPIFTDQQDRDKITKGHPLSLRTGMHLSPSLFLLPIPTDPVPAGPGDPGPRLSQLSVSDVTTSSLRLNWEAPLGAFDSFLLRFGVPLPSTLEPHPRPLLQRELMVPGARRSAVLRDLRPGTLYSLTLYGLRGPHKADSIQGTARTLSPGEDPQEH